MDPEVAKHYSELTKGRSLIVDPRKLLECYDELAETYDEHANGVGYGAPARAVRRFVEVVTDSQCRILDVGCGTGQLGELLHKEGYRHIYGLDPSAKSCEVARRKGYYVEVIQGMARSDSLLKFEDGHFHAIVSSGSFGRGHCDQRDLPEPIRLLQPGGFMVISTRQASFRSSDEYLEGITDYCLKSALNHYTATNVLEQVSYQEYDDYFSFSSKDDIGIVLTYRKN